MHFYPRSPRGERPSAWVPASCKRRHFYPRSPRGERPNNHHTYCRMLHFYPRSPRGERRPDRLLKLSYSVFLSTLPAWGATKSGGEVEAGCLISIHAPRVGSDQPRIPQAAVGTYFYPRSPRGERLGARAHPGDSQHFYPRSPRGERPVIFKLSGQMEKNFYPRSPRGERRRCG